MLFQAGWPWPFYGGSGGFAGNLDNNLMASGLVLDIVFLFLVVSALLFAPVIFKKLSR